jgi:replication-associated recombination protein RarA
VLSSYQPLSELLRPRQLGDLTLPQPIIDRLQRMIDTRIVMNMLFYGKPGLGKTSAARLIIDAVGREDSIEINGARLPSAQAVSQKVEPFVTSMSVFGGSKICFIDEADAMARSADATLRSLIEKAKGHCAFILTANYVQKLSDGLRSRFVPVCFDVSGTQRQAVIERWLPGYQARLPELGVRYDRSRLEQLIGIYFPDLRRIAELIEFEFC